MFQRILLIMKAMIPMKREAPVKKKKVKSKRYFDRDAKGY